MEKTAIQLGWKMTLMTWILDLVCLVYNKIFRLDGHSSNNTADNSLQ